MAAESKKGFAGLESLRSNVETDIAAARAAARQNSKNAPSSTPRPSAGATPRSPPLAAPPEGEAAPPRSRSVGGGWIALIVVGLIAWALFTRPDKSTPVAAGSRSATAFDGTVPFEESKPPVGTNHVLYGAQINYCIAEELRLEGMREAAESNVGVGAFNEAVDDYNSRCSSYRYQGNAVASARGTVTAHATALRAAGYGRAVPSATRTAIDWDKVGAELRSRGETAYVVVDSANVRASPNGTAPIVAKLPALSPVDAQASSGDWVPIHFDQDGRERSGFVARRLLEFGSAAVVRARYCAPERPRTGSVLQQSQRGSHSIRVTAGGDDVVTKLKSPAGTTVVAFYVRSGESATLDSIPEGSYRVLFATGRRYSQKCGEFLDDMAVQQDPNLASFQTTSDATNVYTSIAEYRLIEQTNGNFRPQSATVDSFRD